MGILNHTSIFKKAILVLALSVYLPVHAEVSSNETITKFIVTGYYSPLPEQEDYITGTYEGDKRLNGNGTHSASGNEILTGVIAAPSSYDFGTKIYLKGYGIGVVEDRGGAIVEAGVRGHEYDRIDVWMGSGDAGRIRAINWGVRTVEGKIIDIDEEVTLSLTEGIDESYKDIRVNPDSSEEEIIPLQKLLKNLGFYSGEISGKYSDIEESFLNFQKSLGIIKNKDDWGAGYYGPKTIQAISLKYGYGNGLQTEKNKPQLSELQIAKLDKIIGKLHSKLDKIPSEKQRKKLTEELLEDIDRLLLKDLDSILYLKLEYIKENL